MSMNEISEFKGEYHWLSNMTSIQQFVIDGIAYNTVENFYQGQKTESKGQRITIARMNPYESKQYGGRVEIRKDWDSIKQHVMLQGLKRKFEQKKFLNLLVNTGTMYISEGNFHGDTYWGVCKKTGRGRNILGKLLIAIRTQFFEQMEQREYTINKYPSIKKVLDLLNYGHFDPIMVTYLQNEYIELFIKQFGEDVTVKINTLLETTDKKDILEYSPNLNSITVGEVEYNNTISKAKQLIELFDRFKQVSKIELPEGQYVIDIDTIRIEA